MKNFKILLKLMKQNFFKNIVILIQIVFSIYAVTVLLSEIISYTETKDMLSRMGLEDEMCFSEALHISTLMEGENRTEKYQVIKEYFKELDGVEWVSNTYVTRLQKQNFETFMYDEELIKNIKFNLDEGSNFNEDNLKNDTIPIVVSYSLSDIYKINNIYEFEIYDKTKDSNIKFKTVVIGVLKEEAYIYTGNANQSNPQVDDLFTKLSKDENMIIMPNRFKETNNYVVNKGFTLGLKNKEVFMKESYQKVIDSGLGSFVINENLQDNFYNNLISNYKYYIYTFIITYIFVIASVGGYNLLETLNYKRLFTIYYINGMTWKKGITLIAIRNLIVIIVPTIVSSIISNKILNEGQLSIKVVLITTFMYFIVFLLTTVGTVITLKNTKPSEVLKEVD